MIFSRFLTFGWVYFRKSSVKLVISLLLLVFGLEIGGRLFITNSWVLATTSNISSLNWQLKWEKANLGGAATAYSIDVFDSLLGWVPKKSSQIQSWSDNLVTFSEAGYRGSQVYQIPKPADKLRIVVLGDSFTFGEEVEDFETYPAYLEQLIPNSEVINFGVHGYGLDQMLLRLQQVGLSYQPDIVIFAFINDDLNRALLSFRDYQKPKFQLISNKLVITNYPLLEPNLFRKKTLFRSNFLTALNLLRERIDYKVYPQSQIEDLAMAIWQEAEALTQSQNAKFVMLFLPTGDEMVNQQTRQVYTEDVMAKYCPNRQIKCLSARKYTTQAAGQGTIFNLKRHYEPQTHQIIAKGLATDLQEVIANNQP